MMTHMGEQITDIADMPRGGPDASLLDRLLQTDRPDKDLVKLRMIVLKEGASSESLKKLAEEGI